MQRETNQTGASDQMDGKLLRRLVQIRDELNAILEEAGRSKSESPDSAWRRWFRRAGAVLNDVEQAGGKVTPDEWRSIGQRHNYDPRGLAGFYSGREPSMRRARRTDDRVLTERGEIEAEKWQRMFGDGA